MNYRQAGGEEINAIKGTVGVGEMARKCAFMPWADVDWPRIAASYRLQMFARVAMITTLMLEMKRLASKMTASNA